MAFLLAMLLAAPLMGLAQDSKAATEKRFSQEELDQLLAPVALYPDSLLAQVLMASTYPLEVVMADRWVKQSKNLTGDELIEAVDKQPWDPSVKALVPFPDLLSTMAEKLEWTEKLGDAFLAQQTDVMETVQNLREKAYEAGNLKSTDEQQVIVEKETILVEPADSRVVHVPVYDPWWVYGSWWWPYYPPYVFSPYPDASAFYYPGYIGFSVGFVVGAYWGNWGYCNWPYRTVYVNHHYYGRPHPRYRKAPVGSVVASRGAPTMQKWRHDPYHRRRVAYKDAAVGNQFGQASRTPMDNRRVSRAFKDIMARSTAAAKADAATRTGIANNVGKTTGASNAPIDRRGRPGVSVSKTSPVRADADRGIGGHREARSSPTMERSARIDTSFTARKAIEQGGFDRKATQRTYQPLSPQGVAPSAPAVRNRGVTVSKPANRGRGESVSAPKAQNRKGVLGGQGNVGSASSRGGAVRAGGGTFSPGGPGGRAGGGRSGGSFHRDR